jgi:hypothetical protein
MALDGTRCAAHNYLKAVCLGWFPFWEMTMACMFWLKCEGVRTEWSWVRAWVAWPLALMMCLGAELAFPRVVPANRAASGAGSASVAASAPKAAASAVDTGLAGLRVSAAMIAFGQQQLGSTSAVKSITLSVDPAASATTAFEIHASGDFTVAPTHCEIAAEGSCALSVSFAPQKSGETSSAIVISSAQGGPTRVVAELAGEGIEVCQASGLFPCTGWRSLAPVGFLALLYGVVVIMARWNMVALPTRALLQAEIDAVEARLDSLKCAGSAPKACHDQVTALLSKASKCVKESSGPSWLMDVAFWSRGKEQAGWQLVHEAKEQMTALLPPQDLRVALEGVEVQLRQDAGAEAVALADLIHAELAHTQLDASDCPVALLRETLVFVTTAASDVAADVAAMLDTGTPAKSTDMAALAARLLKALAPMDVLSVSIKRALAAAMPCECQVLLEHASTVLLEQAALMHDRLTDTPQASGEVNLQEEWRHRLEDFQQQFLLPADAFRRCLESALASAPWPQSGRRAALLTEARNQLYDSADTEFASIASWHKKTAWLVGSALLMIVCLSATFGHATLFLLGALGGLMSRLSRVLVRQQLPTDYGFSWTTLFLSPMVGALAGWAGVLLLALAVKYKVLGEVFATVSWSDSQSELVMGLAVVLGISERLFVKIVEGVEGKMGTGAAADATAVVSVNIPNPTTATPAATVPANTTPAKAAPAAKAKVTTSVARTLYKR